MGPVTNDLAIALFVLDIGLIIWDDLHAEKTTDNGSTTRPHHGGSRLIDLQPCPCCGNSACAGRRPD